MESDLGWEEFEHDLKCCPSAVQLLLWTLIFNFPQRVQGRADIFKFCLRKIGSLGVMSRFGREHAQMYEGPQHSADVTFHRRNE